MADDAIDAAVETVEDVIDTVEDIFLPKPGGMVARHREEKARREAAEAEAKNVAQRVEQPAYKAVKTAAMSPDIIVSSVVNIAPKGVAMVLPYSPYRFRAVIQLGNAQEADVMMASGLNTFVALPLGARIQSVSVNLATADANTTIMTLTNLVSSGGSTQLQWALAPGQTAFQYSFNPPVANNGLVQTGFGVSGDATAIAYVNVVYTMPTENILIARDQSAALGGVGYPLSGGRDGSAPLALYTRGQVWAYNPGTVTVPVSVIAEIYAPEK